MYRVTVLYGTPIDVDTFDSYYRNVHMPIARKIEGLTASTLTWANDQSGDLTPGIHLIADLHAESKDDMDRVFASEQGSAAAADIANFATGGVTFVYGEEESVL